jgi:hypothetical protein
MRETKANEFFVQRKLLFALCWCPGDDGFHWRQFPKLIAQPSSPGVAVFDVR